MALDEGAGIWRFLSRRQRIGIRIVTVALLPWIIYERGKEWLTRNHG